jgi:hypothetical protein
LDSKPTSLLKGFEHKTSMEIVRIHIVLQTPPLLSAKIDIRVAVVDYYHASPTCFCPSPVGHAQRGIRAAVAIHAPVLYRRSAGPTNRIFQIDTLYTGHIRAKGSASGSTPDHIR